MDGTNTDGYPPGQASEQHQVFAETLHQLGIGGYKRHATNHSVDVWLLSMLSVGVLFFFPFPLEKGNDVVRF